MAHFLICHEHAYKELPGYRSKLLKEALATSSELLAANLTETKICVNKKLSCVAFQNLCGPNKHWNFGQMLKFFVDFTRNLPEPWKTIRANVNVLLEEKNVNVVLEFLEPFCPDSEKHCGKGNRRKRNIPTMALDSLDIFAKDLVSVGRLEGRIRKRAVDPLQMMGLFNKMLCNEEIIIAIAGYYQENYKNLTYSRVWPIKNISAIWCCLAENLKELFHSAPEN